MNYIVNIFKLIVALLCCVCFTFIAAVFASFHSWVLFAVFLLLVIIYAAVAVQSSSIIHVDEDGVRRIFPFRKISMSWADIREVGVVGLNVINSNNKKHTGARYIYFSKHIMTEEERFNMCLKWPPKEVLYLRFSFKRIQVIQRHWKKDITLYNTGKLEL